MAASAGSSLGGYSAPRHWLLWPHPNGLCAFVDYVFLSAHKHTSSTKNDNFCLFHASSLTLTLTEFSSSVLHHSTRYYFYLSSSLLFGVLAAYCTCTCLLSVFSLSLCQCRKTRTKKNDCPKSERMADGQINQRQKKNKKQNVAENYYATAGEIKSNSENDRAGRLGWLAAEAGVCVIYARRQSSPMHVPAVHTKFADKVPLILGCSIDIELQHAFRDSRFRSLARLNHLHFKFIYFPLCINRDFLQHTHAHAVTSWGSSQPLLLLRHFVLAEFLYLELLRLQPDNDKK